MLASRRTGYSRSAHVRGCKAPLFCFVISKLGLHLVEGHTACTADLDASLAYVNRDDFAHGADSREGWWPKKIRTRVVGVMSVCL